MTREKGWRRASQIATVATVMTLGLPVASASAHPPRVPSSFFGANYSPNHGMGLSDSAKHFETMSANRVRQVKVDLSWREVEPRGPQNGSRRYEWDSTDRMMTTLAESRMKPNVTISGTPRWAETTNLLERLRCGDPGIRTARPVDLNSYVAVAGAIAKRYGRDGTFWEGKTSVAPISRYFIWNEANTFPNWCPEPDPVAYAYMLGEASLAIKSHDPAAYVLNGGIPDTAPNPAPGYQQPGDFLREMIESRPGLLEEIDAIGINVFWFNPSESPLDRVVWFRSEMRRAGIPDSEPMLISESGWPTSGPLAISEDERTTRMRKFTRALPRTNCNVPAMMLHTWVSKQANPSETEDWFGVADPFTADLYPSGQRYVKSIGLFRGKTKRKAPREAILNCTDMAPPDRDGDGVPDERDFRPLDPDRT